MVPKLASWADIAIEGGAADLKFLTELRYVGLPGGHGVIAVVKPVRTKPEKRSINLLPKPDNYRCC